MIILLGACHIMCAYMGALGMMKPGSGFDEILIEDGVCASGSIDKVISGKHFNRARRINEHMLDALERNCLDEFVCSSTAPDSSIPDVILENISKLAACPFAVNIMNFEFADTSNQFIQKYEEFQQEVRKGQHGRTAQLWWAYADRVWILMRF